MPILTATQHLQQASSNVLLSRRLASSSHPEERQWSVVVGFYVTVHLAEAIRVIDPTAPRRKAREATHIYRGRVLRHWVPRTWIPYNRLRIVTDNCRYYCQPADATLAAAALADMDSIRSDIRAQLAPGLQTHLAT